MHAILLTQTCARNTFSIFLCPSTFESPCIEHAFSNFMPRKFTGRELQVRPMLFGWDPASLYKCLSIYSMPCQMYFQMFCPCITLRVLKFCSRLKYKSKTCIILNRFNNKKFNSL